MDEPELTEDELATMREGLRLAARHMRIKGAAKVAAARARARDYKEMRAKGEAELSNFIVSITPSDTPFLSLIGKAPMPTIPDWQTDVED